jgi:hypothetical protein
MLYSGLWKYCRMNVEVNAIFQSYWMLHLGPESSPHNRVRSYQCLTNAAVNTLRTNQNMEVGIQLPIAYVKLCKSWKCV